MLSFALCFLIWSVGIFEYVSSEQEGSLSHKSYSLCVRSPRQQGGAHIQRAGRSSHRQVSVTRKALLPRLPLILQPSPDETTVRIHCLPFPVLSP